MLKPLRVSRSSTGRNGQAQTEYVIILVAIAVVCIAITVAFGRQILDLFSDADSELAGMVAETGLEAPGFGGGSSLPGLSGEDGAESSNSGGSGSDSVSSSARSARTGNGVGSSASSGGRSRRSNGDDGSIVRSGDTVITSAAVRPSEGTQPLGDNGSAVTVMSARTSRASWDETGKASSASEVDARTRARVRDEERWGRKRAAAIASEGEPAIAAGPGGLLGFTRMILIGALFLGLAMLGRAVLGGRGTASS